VRKIGLALLVLSGTRREHRVVVSGVPVIGLESGGLFIFYVLTGSDVDAAGTWQLDRDPYRLETSVPGIFACGDVRFSPVKRVASAVGEGSMAIAFVHQYLRETETRVASDRARQSD
jgi:alkyl hydroperoxide reductase subunit AhpF